jgi:hypothetical protein
MRVPPVSERMKEAPAHALRAVFAGIGQVLLVADRIKNRATDTNHAPSAGAPEPAAAASETAAAAADAAAAEAAPAAGPAPVTPDAAAATPAATTPATAPPATAPAAATPATAAPAATTPATAASAATPAAATPATAASAAAAPAAGDLPVANYDELSVPSLRARMRGLNAAQLRILIDYESTHAERGTVLAMFERRLAKVEAGEA